jgi:anti-anti-sigma factor
MDFQYSENIRNKSMLISVVGDCDMYNAKEFLTNIAEKINSGFNSVYIDFSGIIYLDSSGVGAIIKIIQLSREKKVNLKFRGITGTPRKVLKMSNILTIISEDI